MSRMLDVKQILYFGHTHIRRHRRQFTRTGDHAPGSCAPLPRHEVCAHLDPIRDSVNIVIQKCLAEHHKHSAPTLMMLTLKSVYVNSLHGRT